MIVYRTKIMDDNKQNISLQGNHHEFHNFSMNLGNGRNSIDANFKPAPEAPHLSKFKTF